MPEVRWVDYEVEAESVVNDVSHLRACHVVLKQGGQVICWRALEIACGTLIDEGKPVLAVEGHGEEVHELGKDALPLHCIRTGSLLTGLIKVCEKVILSDVYGVGGAGSWHLFDYPNVPIWDGYRRRYSGAS